MPKASEVLRSEVLRLPDPVEEYREKAAARSAIAKAAESVTAAEPGPLGEPYDLASESDKKALDPEECAAPVVRRGKHAKGSRKPYDHEEKRRRRRRIEKATRRRNRVNR